MQQQHTNIKKENESDEKNKNNGNKNNENINYENTYLYITVKKEQKLQYGDMIKIEGEFLEPNQRRNYGGFDYSEYLKTQKIYGTVKPEKIEIIEKNQSNKILTLSNNINLKIKENIEKIVPTRYSALFNGLILGETKNIEENIKEDFEIANISHVLAISGMHITYIIIGLELLLKKLIGKNKTRIITLIILILYMLITGFTPSVVRASIMGIIVTISKMIHKKNDIWTSISFSLLILLIYNPFLITNVGLQLSYLGTIGIILFNKNVHTFLRNIKIRNRKIKYRINRKLIIAIDKIKEMLAVTLSAQIAILPIMFINFNSLGIYFFISNILVSIIIGPIIIIGFICVIISFLSIEISKFISIFLTLGLELLIQISQVSKLPFSKIYVVTPKIWQIIIYYFLVIVVNKIYKSIHNKKRNMTDIRIKNLIAVLKYKCNQKKKKILKISIILIALIIIISNFPQNLKIHFVDVGQGDCTFIVTPENKTILIDGGGSSLQSYDVGESTLIPYILDRGHTKIDYIFISHFDQDHVGGILTVLEELQVGQVFIAKQKEDSENYQKFRKIVQDKKIKVKILKMGDKISINKNLYFDIIWPGSQLIGENSINNNSLIIKLNYKEYSMLFTGDIEKIAEDEILKKYKNKSTLKSDILKVAHHGSKTSTTEEFLKKVNPKIALIGVGENNMFGHPNNQVLEILDNNDIITYRTDKCGEISITLNRKGKIIDIKKCIKK